MLQCYLSLSSTRLLAYLLVSFTTGILFFKLIHDYRGRIPLLENEQTTAQSGCNFVIKRLNGTTLVKPLLSVEQACESPVFAQTKAQLTGLLDSLKQAGYVTDASIYLRGFKNGEWTAINGNKQYHPASLMKVPLLLIYLRMAERNPGLLQQKVRYQRDASAEINPQYYQFPTIQLGQEYSVHELLYYMIAYSDNNATWLLSQAVDKRELKNLMSDFGLPEVITDDQSFTISAGDYATFFKAIYNSTYVGSTFSDYAAQLLNQCAYKDGFVKGLPEGTKIWHKFGEWREAGHDYELHEAGIIYVNDEPYLLTVMTKGTNTDRQAEALARICRQTYQNLVGP